MLPAGVTSLANNLELYLIELNDKPLLVKLLKFLSVYLLSVCLLFFFPVVVNAAKTN
jgi:hypothetical protein